jgi:hypothetical protein
MVITSALKVAFFAQKLKKLPGDQSFVAGSYRYILNL